MTLCKIRAPNGSDGSNVEILRAKPGVQYVFPRRWCAILKPVSPGCCKQGDLSGPRWEELWTAEGLQIPVYHTENGG
jgi:hypothetical protein